MKKIMLCSILCLLFYTSCKNTRNDNPKNVYNTGGEIPKILIDNIPETIREIKLSDLISGFQIIPLETKNECLLANTKTTISNEFIFVGTEPAAGRYGNPARLFRFDKKGVFLNEIGSVGKGPREHIGERIGSVEIFEESNTILIYWLGSNENAQLFKFDGEYICDIKIPVDLISNTYKFSEQEWFSIGNIVGRAKYARDSFNIIAYNKDGHVTKLLPRTNYIKSSSKGYTPYSHGTSVFKFDKHNKIYIPGVDTIFKLENRVLIPSEILYRGGNGMPYNTIIQPNEIIGKYYLDNFSENDNNIFFRKTTIKNATIEEYMPGKWIQSVEKEENILIVIDKKSKNAAYVKIVDDLFHLLPAELINYGMEWYKQYFEYNWQDNGILIITLQAQDLKNLISELEAADIEKSKELNELLDSVKNITENSNPIIFAFDIKDKIGIE